MLLAILPSINKFSSLILAQCMCSRVTWVRWVRWPTVLLSVYKCNLLPVPYTTEKVQCTDSNGCTYDVGMSYINASCSGRCTCGANGISGCVSLCPPRLIKCHPGQVLQDYYEPVKGTWCYCKRQRCVQGKLLWRVCVCEGGGGEGGWSYMKHPAAPNTFSICRTKLICKHICKYNNWVVCQ